MSKAIFYVAAAALGIYIVNPSDIFTSKAELEKRAEVAAAEKVKEQERRSKGLHCLRSYDGGNFDFQWEVKRYLKDPDSFKHVETRIGPNEGGKHVVIMSYRAKNSFGGYTSGIATGHLSNADCKTVGRPVVAG